MRKNHLNALTLALFAAWTGFGPGTAQAASVGAGGYTNSFATQPLAADWSTFAIAGAAADATMPAQIDAEVQLVAAASISAQTVLDAASPPGFNASATWSSTAFYLQTRPTGNRVTLLMCTLVNNLGVAASAVSLSYDFTITAPNADEISGHNTYYSLTGATGSWIPIPALSFAAVSGKLTANLNLAWPNGSPLYLLWADDNSVNSPDTANQIDNFSAIATPATQTPAMITSQPQSQAVPELAPASFTVGVSGNPAPSIQWYQNDVAIGGANSATYAIASAPLSESGTQFKVVIANTASNVNYSVTSSVAVLTVNADTVRPTLVRAIGVPPTTVSIDFSEPLRTDTANVAANYAITSSMGNLTISDAVLQANGSNVLLTTSPQTLGVTYTLIVNGVRDVSAASNQISPNSTTAFTTVSFVLTDIGSPSPGGSLVPSGNGYDITVGGADIGGTADQFTFNYQTLPGDFDVKVRLAGLSLSDVWGKAGLMARESFANNARYAASLATPSVSGCYFQYRATAGTASAFAGSFPATYPNAWLRLKRVGAVFSGFASLDGSTWSSLGSVTIAGMPSQLVVGLCVSSRTNGVSTTAQFRDYMDVLGNPPARSVSLPMEPLGPSARRSPLAISEIMYHPRIVGDLTNRSLEFIEIFNSQAFSENLGGYRLSGAIDYTFAPNTVIRAGGFLVVARDPAFVQSHYGVTGVLGPWSGLMTNGTDVLSTNSLPGGSGLVRLRNRAGAVLLQVNYLGANPWPIAADGSGHSLVLNRASYGEGDPRAWAASDSIDGSPGRAEPFSADPLRNVVVNEFLAHTAPDSGLEDSIELYNHGNQSVDLSGAILTDETDTNKFRIPNGTVLPPRGFTNFTQATLGFALSADGERIFLINSNATRVIDAVAFDAQASGRSSGRVPDGAPSFYPLASRTPGAANGPRWQSPVVINELMYSPISGNSDDEYVELYNRSGDTVDLGRWRLADGISYNFPSNTLIAPGGYLVVANNATNLIAHYPGVLNNVNTVGNYGGSLGNGGERVALLMPAPHVTTNGVGQFVTNTLRVLASDVAYGDGGRWGTWTDGGGSSLELKDPDTDTRLAANWADSDETAKSTNLWTNVEFSGPLGESLGSPLNDRLLIFNLGIGECLVDEVEVHNGAGPNLVLNGGFESGMTSWLPQGSHDFSTIENFGYAGARCLHLRAASRGDNGQNRIRTDGTAFAVTSPVTIRAKVRWLRGWPEICLRIRGGTAEAVGLMQVPLNLGTPGQRNSRAVTHAGPAIYEVSHSPVLPQSGETVVVTAKVDASTGLGSLALRYRVDAGNTNSTPALFTSLIMLDNGAGADAIAGDGVYSAAIPVQSAGATVAFYLQATNVFGVTNLFPQDVFPEPGQSRVFPNDALARECVVRWGEVQMTGSFATYHLWLTAANSNRWRFRGHNPADNPNTSALNNSQLDGTFVYNNYRVVYNATPLFAGSPWHRGSLTTGPCGDNRCDAVMNFPSDDRMLGNTDFVLNNPGNPGGTSTSDTSAQTEQTSYTIFKEIGVVYNYRRYVHWFINGNQRSTTSNRSGNYIFEDSQQPNSDMIEEWWPDDTDGDFYKIEDWFEFPDNGHDFSSNNDADLTRRTILLGGQNTLAITPYRFMFRKRAVGPGESAADYTNFFNLVDAVSPASNPGSTTVDAAAMNAIADYDQWMRIFAVQHAIGNWDSYGYRRGKNDYMYKPQSGAFEQLTWDIDFTMGVGGDGTGQTIFDASDPRVTAMWATPVILRSYYRGFLDIVNGPLQNSFMDPILDAKHAALLANNVNADPGTVTTIKNYISGRRANLLTQIAGATPAFAVTGTNFFTTNNNLVTLTGVASVAARDIAINGVIYPVTWSGSQAAPVNWTLRVALNGGTNTLVIQGVDASGNAVPGASRTVTVVYTGPSSLPEDSIVFNEIMYKPTNGASYVELYNKNTGFSFDVSGWRVNGLDFTFPAGSILGGGQYLVLAKNRLAFSGAYGTGIPVAGQFDGNLDLDGETLTLLRPAAIQPASTTPSASEVVIDKVRYEAQLPWVPRANGGGASLQLIDASIDNSRVSDWSDGVGWRYYSTNINLGGSVGSRLFAFLDAPGGEVYIDDISLVALAGPTAGSNYIQNGGFETELSGPWSLGTNFATTVISTAFSRSGNGSLRLIATAAPAAINTLNTFSQEVGAATNLPYTLSYYYLPTPNANKLTIRFNSTARPETIVKPGPLSTPGSANLTVSTLPAYDPVWLNEIQPNNATGPMDGAMQRDPWVELYNGGSNTVSLAGYYLTDSYTNNLTRWQFPMDATIGPNEFKLVWLDATTGQTTASEWHANFTPGLVSGQIALVRLVNNTPQITDYLTYSNLGPSLSYGDFPDGQPFSRQTFYSATPTATNYARSTTAFINEWMASNTNYVADPADGQYKDWFEIYNAATNALDLGNYYLTDNLNQPTRFRVPNNGQYVVPAGGFLLVWADSSTNLNTPDNADLHAGFSLGQGGEDIGLYAPDGATVVDTVTFAEQYDNISQGRFADGAAAIYLMTNATPRGANTLNPPGLNQPPTINPIADLTVTRGLLASNLVTATDPDAGQTLTFSLDVFPANAQITAGGIFTWPTGMAAAPGTNDVTVRVKDSGSPQMSATRSFKVFVVPPPIITVNNPGNGQVSLTIPSVPGHRYQLLYKDNLNDANWLPKDGPVTATGATLTFNDNLGANPQRFYQVQPLD